MTRGNEISKQPLLLFQDCACCLLTVSVEMWLRLNWCRFLDTNSCTLQLWDTADCICSLSLTVWLQGSSSTAQMGMLISMQAALTDVGIFFFLMLHKILPVRIWQQDIAEHTTKVRRLTAPDTRMNKSWETHHEPAKRWAYRQQNNPTNSNFYL